MLLHCLRVIIHAFIILRHIDPSIDMNDHSRLYFGAAFVAGVVLTVGFNDLVYPQLQQRLRQNQLKGQSKDSIERNLSKDPNALTARDGPPAIVDGIEGCIGNTHLLRIKSLSDETGCEILAKAEVRDPSPLKENY